MYSPFLWQIAKGQSRPIIKRRWSRWLSKTHQLCMQRLKLREHIHQKLTMSRLNGHDSVQHTTNARIIQSRRWRISGSSRINICICSQITWRSRRRCNTRRGLNSRSFKASSHLSSSLPKEGGTYKSYNVNRLKCRKLL